jgi:TatD DNase family protein
VIDAHAHLTDRRFATDLADVLERARKAGIGRVLTAAEDVASSEAALALAADHDDIRVAVGVHPHHAASWNVDALSRLTELARDPHVVAIGEIGMDFSGRSAPPDAQGAAFRGQLALASLLGLPVVIHVRDAGERVRAILAAMRGPGGAGPGAPGAKRPRIAGMIHCYSEGPDELPAWLDFGLYISFAGTVTYPGSDQLRTAARLVPADRLLAETDAPYLAPQNARGRRNEPLYVAATHAALARERGLDIGDLAGQIAANARRLFGERWEPSLPA